VSSTRKLVRPLAVVGALGTIASVWWFALKPRRKKKKAAGASSNGANPSAASVDPTAV
jgi:hypothetical protein